MIVWTLYLIFVRLTGWMALLARSAASKDALPAAEPAGTAADTQAVTADCDARLARYQAALDACYQARCCLRQVS